MALPIEFKVGTIKDSFAHTGLYIVTGMNGELLYAREMLDTGTLPTGSRPLSMYPVGTTVFIADMPPLGAIILGSVPSAVGSSRVILPSSIVPRSQVGQWQDQAHYDALKNEDSGAVSYSLGRPVDALPGDWGRTNDLGLMFMLGRLMVAMKASEGAQVQAFYGDNLLRLIGYNYQKFTAGSEESCLHDEGEYREVVKMTPFPWEAMGKLAAGASTRTEDGSLEPDALYLPTEPKFDDQQMVYRHLRFRGYLGDVEREYVCMPPTGDAMRYSQDDLKYTGLLELCKSIDGSYSVRSAKQITFEKYVLLPIPKEKASAEDPKGDTGENYKFAGVTGEGEDHALPEFKWSADTPYIRAAQLWDYHAYLFGKYAQIGLIRHTKDWVVPEESDVQGIASKAINDNIQIGHKFYADLPSMSELVIDQRTNHSVKFYASRSIIKQLDDGGILLEDGYGSQIRMEGGNIFITCVGDVWTMPGRNAITWAPHDVIQKAGNSVDITAAKKDVRVKAEQNVHVLAANGRSGSLLMECRANKHPVRDEFDSKIGEDAVGGGIFLKCKDSTVTTWGKRVYVGGIAGSSSEILLDAGEAGTTVVRGRSVTMHGLTNSAMVAGDTNKSTLNLAYNSLIGDAAFNFLGGFLVIRGASAGLLLDGSAVIADTLLVDGQVISNTAVVGYQQRQMIPNERKVPIRPAVGSFDKVVTAAVSLAGSTLTSVEPLIEGNDAVGSKELQASVGFSCRRTVEDLKLEEDSFKLPPARWQTVLFAKGSNTPWDEPVVKYPDADGSTETYPHPGKEAWKDWQVWQETSDKNFITPTGLPVARAELSEEPNNLTPGTLADNYTINVQE